mgnify:FL=1
MNPVRISARGRTVHAYTGWSALPAVELAALRRAALARSATEDPALASELLALIDRETAKRNPGTAPGTGP